MKLKILLAVILAAAGYAQQVYNVTPGTKQNKITFTVANISELNKADNIQVRLLRESPFLRFSSKEQNIKMLEQGQQADVTFSFDAERNAEVNTEDTVRFFITDESGSAFLKQFVLRYTAPSEFRLEQNFPNPFNPSTVIQYQLPFDSRVSLKIYNVLGKELAVLVDETQSAGYKEISFNGSYFSSGVYIYRLSASGESGSYSSVKKMLLVK